MTIVATAACPPCASFDGRLLQIRGFQQDHGVLLHAQRPLFLADLAVIVGINLGKHVGHDIHGVVCPDHLVQVLILSSHGHADADDAGHPEAGMHTPGHDDRFSKKAMEQATKRFESE